MLDADQIEAINADQLVTPTDRLLARRERPARLARGSMPTISMRRQSLSEIRTTPVMPAQAARTMVGYAPAPVVHPAPVVSTPVMMTTPRATPAVPFAQYEATALVQRPVRAARTMPVASRLRSFALSSAFVSVLGILGGVIGYSWPM